MDGIGEIIGWLGSLMAVKNDRAPRGGESQAAVQEVRYMPATTLLFIFVLWLLQFVLPAVFLARLLGTRELTLRAANAQAVLLLGTLFGNRMLRVSPRTIELLHDGRAVVELPLKRLTGVEVVETWLTQGIVIHSEMVPGGRLPLWVADPAAVALAVQRAAASSEEAC